jgi:hypothetical protein
VLAFGQVPVLQIDGMNLAQTGTIVRYLSKKFGYYPQDLKEATRAEVCVICLSFCFVLSFSSRSLVFHLQLQQVAKRLRLPGFFPGCQVFVKPHCEKLVQPPRTRHQIMEFEEFPNSPFLFSRALYFVKNLAARQKTWQKTWLQSQPFCNLL